MSNTLDVVKNILSYDFTIMAYDCIANKNNAVLYQMGLDDEAIECLKQIEKKDIKLTTKAFEKALSIQTYVDPTIIRRVLLNCSKEQQQENLVNNLVVAGAGFEMIRHFIKTYTNRKHTQLRQEFSVNDSVITNTTVSADKADEYFSSFIVNNKSINAQDILRFSQENNYSLSSMWRELKEFTNNAV